jgi:hypothetical protein
MAIETGRITINETAIIELDSSPLTGGGFDSPVGTLSVDKTTGMLYRKQNTSPTGWEIMSRGNVRATGEVQTTSPNFVDLSGMSITPVAGTYLVFAMAQTRQHRNVNQGARYNISIDNSAVADTELEFRRGGGQTSNVSMTYNMSCEVTVNGS